jgi:hypothetical protein
MAELEAGKPVSLQELTVSTLAMTDAFAKLLMRRASSRGGVQQKLLEERAVYQRILNPTNSINGFRLS